MVAARNYVRTAGAWVPSTFLPAGGTIGQVLVKTSATDYATAWQNPRAVTGRLTDATTAASLTVATTAYTAGDQVGILETIASALPSGATYGYIVGLQVVDQGDVCPLTAGYDVDFWFSSPTLAANNAAYAVSAADALLRAARIELPSFRDDGANRSASWWGRVPIVSTDTSLRYSYITRGDHPVFATGTDLNITVYLET